MLRAALSGSAAALCEAHLVGTPIMENQMEKNMENEMEAGIIRDYKECSVLFGDTHLSRKGFRVQGSGFKGLGFRVYCSGFQGSGFRV